MATALILFAVLSLGPVTGSDNGPPELILALQRATSYLENAHHDFILDGLVGYRFLKDWIHELLKQKAAETDRHLKWQELKRIEKKLCHLIEETLGVLNETDGEYVKDFEPLFKDGFWQPPSSWDKTDPALIYTQTSKKECFDLKFSNLCIMNILGTSKETATACSVPPFCKYLMTLPDCYAYSLSHQLFYFMIANQRDCTNNLFKEKTEFYERKFCANMKKFNEETESQAYPVSAQDLFMENIMLCAMSGFSDFLKPQWLKAILSWQDPVTGCFGKNAIPAALNTTGEHNTNRRARRVKRRERLLTDGCLCHMTSVAVGALAAFISTL